MAREGRGAIVNVSSVYGLLSPQQDVYEFRRSAGESSSSRSPTRSRSRPSSTSTRYLATYWARSGVRVNTLTLAGVANDQPREFLDAYEARVPLGRMLEAGEAVGAGRLPRLGRVLVRHRREPRRRRRVDCLVSARYRTWAGSLLHRGGTAPPGLGPRRAIAAAAWHGEPGTGSTACRPDALGRLPTGTSRSRSSRRMDGELVLPDGRRRRASPTRPTQAAARSPRPVCGSGTSGERSSSLLDLR